MKWQVHKLRTVAVTKQQWKLIDVFSVEEHEYGVETKCQLCFKLTINHLVSIASYWQVSSVKASPIPPKNSSSWPILFQPPQRPPLSCCLLEMINEVV